jgi:Ca-activated chloride channel homolog
MRARIWSSILVTLFLIPLVAAQVQYAVITGVVTDSSGAVLPGVTVTLTGADQRTTLTNSRGEFTFVRLDGGEYQLEFFLSGFTTVRYELRLAGGRTERLTIQMAVGALQETVTVTGSTPTVDVQSSLRGVPAGQMNAFAGGLPPGGRLVGPFNTEAYDHIEENKFRRVDADPLSTFSIDVDTASYANVRRFLTDGNLPPAGAVRIEELVNYFRFDYPRPSNREPFSITMTFSPSAIASPSSSTPDPAGSCCRLRPAIKRSASTSRLLDSRLAARPMAPAASSWPMK